MGELAYHDEAAAEYDKAFAHVSRHFLPFLLRAARIAPGMKVLDVATGTGLAAEEALLAVGTDGHVVAADLSDAMVEQAKRRLGAAPNITFAVEDGQSLSFAEGSFDALICSLGLMFFPAPSRGTVGVLACAASGRTRCGLCPHCARTFLQRPDQHRHGQAPACDK